MTTASVADQLKILAELQKLDSRIYGLRRELGSKPAQVAGLKEGHSKAAQALQSVEARYKSLEVKRNQMETELGQREEQIKKLQVQLFQLKTNKDYAAMQKEIAGFKADKSVLEEEILKLMEESDRAKAQLASEKEALKAQEAALQTDLQRVEEEAQMLKASLQGLESARGALTPKVESTVLAQYERILERKEGFALALVQGDACGGCHMNLPPQLIVEILQNDRVVTCESCTRILIIEPSK